MRACFALSAAAAPTARMRSTIHGADGTAPDDLAEPLGRPTIRGKNTLSMVVGMSGGVPVVLMSGRR